MEHYNSSHPYLQTPIFRVFTGFLRFFRKKIQDTWIGLSGDPQHLVFFCFLIFLIFLIFL